MFTEDLGLFFSGAEFAVSADWAGQAAQVILDMPTEDVLGGRAQSSEYLITIPSGVWQAIGRNHTITAAGAGYVVREVRLLDDGALKQLKLTRA